jgi:hypothetical protein
MTDEYRDDFPALIGIEWDEAMSAAGHNVTAHLNENGHCQACMGNNGSHCGYIPQVKLCYSCDNYVLEDSITIFTIEGNAVGICNDCTSIVDEPVAF